MSYINFSLLLTLLSIITGLIVLFDKFYLQKKRKKSQKTGKIVEYAHSFFPVFIIVLILRSFILEPFRIPSGSLEPTLRIGDFVAVSKFSYGLHLPVLETKILSLWEPKLADIAVFRWPADPRFDYIKRVIGVPGDVISYDNKILSVNGVVAKQKFIRYTTDESTGHVVSEYEETLGNVKHSIYINTNAPAHDFKVTIPAHYYFMMGDNRDDSADSRFWGLLHESYLRGKAFLVWMSWDSHTYSVRWKRIGSIIH